MAHLLRQHHLQVRRTSQERWRQQALQARHIMPKLRRGGTIFLVSSMGAGQPHRPCALFSTSKRSPREWHGPSCPSHLWDTQCTSLPRLHRASWPCTHSCRREAINQQCWTASCVGTQQAAGQPATPTREMKAASSKRKIHCKQAARPHALLQAALLPCLPTPDTALAHTCLHASIHPTHRAARPAAAPTHSHPCRCTPSGLSHPCAPPQRVCPPGVHLRHPRCLSLLPRLRG